MSRGGELAGPIALVFGKTRYPIDYGFEGSTGIEWTWRRGFVESITLPAADWLRHADALLAATPVREVHLTTWPEPGFARGYIVGDPIITQRILTRRFPGVRFHLPPRWDVVVTGTSPTRGVMLTVGPLGATEAQPGPSPQTAPGG